MIWGTGKVKLLSSDIENFADAAGFQGNMGNSVWDILHLEGWDILAEVSTIQPDRCI